MPVEPRRVKELFVAAVDLTDEAARHAFLDRECAGDAELRRRLEALLHANDQPQPALDQPLASRPFDSASAPTEPAPITEEQFGAILVGKYKLLERIGEGGMGSVWMAQQTEPVKRTVAVKLIKDGGDSKAVLARFEAERQALALMDHPNIARVLDGGTTENGRPFFVMELVKGVPITKFCDTNKLTPRQRLELFIPVCQAIQHAHQKGIIHRDVKPSNVLIALYDDKPVPKVIDFGVAKAAGAQLTEQTLVTGFGAIVGTPQYMSPEQATLNNFDIDTRSDIYSLGALLYELLAGSPPFARKELAKAGMLEILRVIREEEPPKLSTKVSTANTLASLAANRSTEPAKLTRLLRGEIDWIVMKALEKERSRRYETANGFAMDIQRYLADEPVLAGPPSAAYRFKKFVKRHKGQVVAVGLVLLALLAGMAGTTTGLVRAEKARQAEAQRAEGERLAKQAAETAAEAEKKAKLDAEASAKTEKEAKEQAEKRLKQFENGIEILTSLFHDLDPKSEEKEGEPLRVLLGKRLDEAVKQLDGEALGDPVVVARLQVGLGNSLRELGRYEQAEAVLAKGRQTLEASLGPDDPDTLTAKHNLALVYQALGKDAAAETLFKDVLARSTTRLGANHEHTLLTKGNLADLYRTQNNYKEAEKLLKEVLAVQTAKLGADHPHTLNTMNNLALVYRIQAQYVEAEKLLQEVLAGQIAQRGADHPDALTAKHNLAAMYFEQGNVATAEKLFKEALAGRTTQLGADHPSTLATKNNLAELYRSQGRYVEAEPLFKEVLAGSIARLGANHLNTLLTKDNLAYLYRAQGRYAEAEPLCKEALAGLIAQQGPDNPDTLTTKNNLALIYQGQKKYAEAEPLFKEALTGLTTQLGANHPTTLDTLNNFAEMYRLQGKFTEAEPLYKELLAGQTARRGADHPSTFKTKETLASVYWSMKQPDRAIALLEELTEQRKKKQGATHPDTLYVRGVLGVCYRDAGRTDDGLHCLEEVAAAIQAMPGPVPANLVWVPNQLAQTYDRAKQYAKSEPLYREFLQQGRKKFGDDDPRTASLMAQLAMNLLAQKKHADAETILRDSLAICEKKQPDDWSAFFVKSMLGEALVGQKKYADAEPLLKDGYDGLKKREDKIPAAVRKMRLTEALQRLVQLYEATDNKDEAAKWRKQLDAVKDAPKQP